MTRAESLTEADLNVKPRTYQWQEQRALVEQT